MYRSLMLIAAGATLIGGLTLSTDYARERTLSIESQTTIQSTSETTMERDGEPMEGRGGFGARETETSRHVVQLDQFLESEDGAPTRVRRTWEQISAESSTTFGDRDMQTEFETPLEEVTLELTYDEDGELVIEVVEGSEPDEEEVLEGHLMDLALDALLTEDEVEEGDTWELEGEALVRALGLDLESALFRRVPPDFGGGEGREGRGGGRRFGGGRGESPSLGMLFGEAEWEAEAKVESEEEEQDGLTCVLIVFEARGEGDLEEPERDSDRRELAFGPGEPTSRVPETSYEIELEGKFWFCVENGHPVRLEVEGTIELDRTVEREMRESYMVINTLTSTEFEHVVEVSEVTD